MNKSKTIKEMREILNKLGNNDIEKVNNALTKIIEISGLPGSIKSIINSVIEHNK